MTPREAAILSAYAEQCCPQQKFNEFTGDAWGDLLVDIRFVDAKEAVVAITRRSPWISPAEIITEVKRIRAKRIDEFGPVPPPPAEELDPDDWRAFKQWQADTQRRIADGELKPADLELDLPERDMRAIDQAFREPR